MGERRSPLQFLYLDRVKLTEEFQGTQFEAGHPIILSSGSIGTVVMEYDGTTFEVEFIDGQGVTYAIETIPVGKLKFFERPSLELPFLSQAG